MTRLIVIANNTKSLNVWKKNCRFSMYMFLSIRKCNKKIGAGITKHVQKLGVETINDNRNRNDVGSNSTLVMAWHFCCLTVLLLSSKLQSHHYIKFRLNLRYVL